MCTKAFLYKSVQSVCSKMFTDFVPSQINMNTIECFTESSYIYHIYILCICLVFINPYVPSVMFPYTTADRSNRPDTNTTNTKCACIQGNMY